MGSRRWSHVAWGLLLALACSENPEGDDEDGDERGGESGSGATDNSGGTSSGASGTGDRGGTGTGGDGGTDSGAAGQDSSGAGGGDAGRGGTGTVGGAAGDGAAGAGGRGGNPSGGASGGPSGGAGGNPSGGTGATSGMGGAAGMSGGPNLDPECTFARSEADCIMTGKLCPSLVCGLGDVGRQTCVCDGEWVCSECDFRGTYIEARPSNIQPCSAVREDDVCATAPNSANSVCSSTAVVGEFCMCATPPRQPMNNPVWSCDVAPSTW